MGSKKYKMIEPPMGVVTVTLPTSDTKKVLVVLLLCIFYVQCRFFEQAHEGAQLEPSLCHLWVMSLLCVHTLNVGIHP